MSFDLDHQEQTPTQFNMGIATVMRIDRLLFESSKINIKFRSAYESHLILLELYRELYPFLKAEEMTEAQEKFLNKINTKDFLFQNRGRVVLYPSETLATLSSFNLWIRLKLYDKGLLMGKGSDPFDIVK